MCASSSTTSTRPRDCPSPGESAVGVTVPVYRRVATEERCHGFITLPSYGCHSVKDNRRLVAGRVAALREARSEKREASSQEPGARSQEPEAPVSLFTDTIVQTRDDFSPVHR